MIFLKNSADNYKLYYFFNMSYENADPVQEGDIVNMFLITLLLS